MRTGHRRGMFVAWAFVIGCSKPAPAPAPPANQAAPAASSAEPAAHVDACAEAKDCKACITASCQWDIDKQACSKQCAPDAKNCLLVGAENIGADRATEVCAGARQP